MKNIKVGTIKPHKLTVSDKKVWSKYMTPEYVYISNDCEYVYLRFEGYDHMEQEWRIEYGNHQVIKPGHNIDTKYTGIF